MNSTINAIGSRPSAALLEGEWLSRETLAIVALTALYAAGVCFWPPSLLESTDYVLFYKPNFHFLWKALREGHLPLWNPYIGLGRPYLADLQMAVFYPPLYLVFLGEKIGLYLLVFGHSLLAVFGLRAFANALEVGKFPGYFMILCFLGSGALMSRWASGQILYAAGLCYLPALFYFAIRVEQPWAAWRIGLYALLLAGQFLTGHPQVFWFSSIGQFAFVLTRAVRTPVQAALRDAARAFFQLGAAFFWCMGLVAVALLPFLELVQQGNRGRPSPAFVSFGRMDWGDFRSLFTGLSASYDVSFEMNLFVGWMVLTAGLAGLLRVRERNVRGLLGVLGIGLLITLADRSPLFEIFLKWLPGFSSFRVHARAGLLIAFALIAGAGIWLGRPHPFLRAVVTANFPNLNTPLRRILPLLLVLQTMDLLYASWRLRIPYSFASYMRLSPEYPFQWTITRKLREAGLLEPSQPPPRVCVPTFLVPQNYAMIYHYSTFDAYTSLFLRRPWAYLHERLGIAPSEMLNTFIAEEIYSRGPFPYPDLSIVAGVDLATGTLQFATNPAPRAFLVYAARPVGDNQSVRQLIAQGHDLQRNALLEQPLAEPLPEDSALSSTPALIRRFEPNSITLEVDARQNALLVLAEAWYPGWKAEVDGRLSAALPANGWMRAIPVPAGRHQVRFFFHQNYLPAGGFLSLISLSCLLVLLLKSRRELPPAP